MNSSTWFKVSFCVSAINHLPIKSQNVSYYEVTTITSVMYDISFAEFPSFHKVGKSNFNSAPWFPKEQPRGRSSQDCRDDSQTYKTWYVMVLLRHFVD